jgi:hypothetical protein
VAVSTVFSEQISSGAHRFGVACIGIHTRAFRVRHFVQPGIVSSQEQGRGGRKYYQDRRSNLESLHCAPFPRKRSRNC